MSIRKFGEFFMQFDFGFGTRSVVEPAMWKFSLADSEIVGFIYLLFYDDCISFLIMIVNKKYHVFINFFIKFDDLNVIFGSISVVSAE